LIEGVDSFKEGNKAMTDALLVKKPVKLIVYSYSEEKLEHVRAMLTILSGLNVKRRGGAFLGRKFYAYFDDVASAQAAALALVRIVSCRTKVCIGTFDVTNLVRDKNTATLKDRKLQAQVSKTSLAKEADSVISAIKRSKTEQHYKEVEKN